MNVNNIPFMWEPIVFIIMNIKMNNITWCHISQDSIVAALLHCSRYFRLLKVVSKYQVQILFQIVMDNVNDFIQVLITVFTYVHLSG